MLITKLSKWIAHARNWTADEKLDFGLLFALYSAYGFAIILLIVRLTIGFTDRADQWLYFLPWLLILPLSLAAASIHLAIIKRFSPDHPDKQPICCRAPVAFEAMYLLIMFHMLTFGQTITTEIVLYLLLCPVLFHIVLNISIIWILRNYDNLRRYLVVLSLTTIALLLGYSLLSVQHFTVQSNKTSASFTVYPIYDRETECFFVFWSSSNVKDVRVNGESVIPLDYNSSHFCDQDANQFTILTDTDEWIRVPLMPTTLILEELLAYTLILIVIPYLSYEYIYLLGIGIVATFASLTLGISLSTLVLSLLLSALLYQIRLPQVRQQKFWLDLLVIIFIMSFTINLDFPHDRWHYNTYLGTVNDIINGKTLLVDTNNQYGFLSLYTLAFIFQLGVLPLDYVGLSFLTSLSMALVVLALYVTIRYITQSWGLSALAAFALTLIVSSLSDWKHVVYPSLGAIRFGIPYLFVLMVCLRYWRYNHHRFAVVPELIVLVISVAWSLSVALFVIIPYILLIGFESLTNTNSFAEWFTRSVRQIRNIFLCVVIAIGLIYGITLLRSGTMPNWGLYLDYFSRISTDIAAYQRPIRNWQPEFLLMVISFITLGTIIIRTFLGQINSWQSTALVLLTVSTGIMQFYFYIQVSVSGHYIALCFPAVVAIAYWLAHYRQLKLFHQIYLKDMTVMVTSGLIILQMIAIASNLHYYMLPSQQAIYRTMTPFRAVLETVLLSEQTDQMTLEKIQKRWNHESGVFFGQPAPHEHEYDEAYIPVTYNYFGDYLVPQANLSDGLDESQADDYIEDRAQIDPYVNETMQLVERYSPDASRIALFLPSESQTHSLISMHKSHIYPIANPSAEIHNETSLRQIESTSGLLAEGDMIYTVDNQSLLDIQAPQDLSTIYPFMSRIVQELCESFSLEYLESTPSGVLAIALVSQNDQIKCTDNHLNFQHITVDIGNTLNPTLFDDGWSASETWNADTIRWMGKSADLSIPACVDSASTLSLRLFNPSASQENVMVSSMNFMQAITVQPDWNDYVINIDDSLCTERYHTELTLSTDYQLETNTDSRELSFAINHIEIVSSE